MTPNKENFIKAIYELGGDHSVISNKKLVNNLSISAASVTEMNARLLKEKLISHVPYRGVKLTSSGIRIAHQLKRKHRIWEVFLFEKLGYDWNEVHADADLLEHVSSDLLIERLNDFLDEPKFDPHGGVIPNKDGSLPETSTFPLTDVGTGKPFKIKEVDDDKEFLNYLLEKDIQLGDRYTLTDVEPFDGPITLETPEGRQITIGHKAAFKILVDYVTE
ncbi:metal-dependent transcriptional regulator [Alkalibacterium putridalgicola]|jgi:DtxR family Mn-dependent transcriptional regulator|uniref:Manganese transport regulator n=1 Tax=Alkalibacterium putridalgicola TaxID=426703 RepID=A0A1H7UQ90_9LACT|nr:metal-dependent transcriptional regulator [Alkalibacterium putridalgicola]GEK88525.1 Cro/Cl family transcriptional regulator [Alkalibacterium putridalgicola]SEL98954.1 iron (metal) dependent repressor, DtxR family [Alkalibacterium putridalgicola]